MSADYADLEGRIAAAPYTLGPLKIIGTRTGRMSSSQPNLQNMPRSAPTFKVGDPVVILSGDMRGHHGLIERVTQRCSEELRRRGLPGKISYDVSIASGTRLCNQYQIRRVDVLDVLADIVDGKEEL